MKLAQALRGYLQTLRGSHDRELARAAFDLEPSILAFVEGSPAKHRPSTQRKAERPKP